MRFDELATRAGRAAAALGSNSQRPSFSEVSRRHRRRILFTSTSLVLVTVGLVAAVALLGPTGTRESTPVGTGTSIAQVTTTEASVPTTEAAPVAVGRDECPITSGTEAAFEPEGSVPDGPPASYDSVWHGTPRLWTMVASGGGVWTGLPVASDGTLTQKTFWWVEDLDSMSAPIPDLSVELRRWGDDTAEAVPGDSPTTGGRPDIGVFVVVGIQVPGEGCWEVTASYGAASLSYVVWVDAS